MAKEKKEKEKKEKDKKEKKEKDAAEKAEKKEKKNKKKGPPRLPPEFVLGARVEITSHDLASMVSKRGISLGEFKTTDTPRKRVRIAVKLEAPLKKGWLACIAFHVFMLHVATLQFVRVCVWRGRADPLASLDLGLVCVSFNKAPRSTPLKSSRVRVGWRGSGCLREPSIQRKRPQRHGWSLTT
jgi:hypothetical protein